MEHEFIIWFATGWQLPGTQAKFSKWARDIQSPDANGIARVLIVDPAGNRRESTIASVWHVERVIPAA